MANRCTPFQNRMKTQAKARAERPVVKEVRRHVFPFSHSFDNLDAGDNRLIWRMQVPCRGVVSDARVSCGAITGEPLLDVSHNGVVLATVPLKESAAPSRHAVPVAKDDVIEVYLRGTGNAKDVTISLVVKEV